MGDSWSPEAKAALEEAQRAHVPGDFTSTLRLAQCAFVSLAVHMEEVERLFLQALDLRPEDPDALFWLAVVEKTHLFDLERAKTLLETLLAKRPDRADAHCLLGSTLEELGAPPELVLMHLRRATELDPGAFYYWLTLAIWAFRNGNKDLMRDAARHARATANSIQRPKDPVEQIYQTHVRGVCDSQVDSIPAR